MILPIVAYGHPVLRKPGVDISPDYPDLKTLIANMFETMYEAGGVGLAAPQIGKGIRLFIVDASPFADEAETEEERKVLEGFKKVFINPQISESGTPWVFTEGCLSIPEIREDVEREDTIHLRWMDEDFRENEAEFNGFIARVIQHEYDHIEGVLFVDHINPLRRNLLSGRLNKIAQGKIRVSYRMKFYQKKRRR